MSSESDHPPAAEAAITPPTRQPWSPPVAIILSVMVEAQNSSAGGDDGLGGGS